MNTEQPQCYFCTNNVRDIDYKEVETIKKFTDDYARIIRRKDSNVCSNHQRKLARAIKHARHMALIPFVQA